jgi:hypothetical protein
MHRRAKPLLFAFFTKRTTQGQFLGPDYFMEASIPCVRGINLARDQGFFFAQGA